MLPAPLFDSGNLQKFSVPPSRLLPAGRGQGALAVLAVRSVPAGATAPAVGRGLASPAPSPAAEP